MSVSNTDFKRPLLVLDENNGITREIVYEKDGWDILADIIDEQNGQWIIKAQSRFFDLQIQQISEYGELIEISKLLQATMTEDDLDNIGEAAKEAKMMLQWIRSDLVPFMPNKQESQ